MIDHVNDLPTFYPSPRYPVLAVAGFLFAALLAWGLRHDPSWETIFFCLVGCVGGGWAVWMASSRVVVNDAGVTLRRWFMAERQVNFQQMLAAGEVGRMTRLIVITYFPRQPNGLLDTNVIHTLALPTVGNQGELVALLQEKAPS